MRTRVVLGLIVACLLAPVRPAVAQLTPGSIFTGTVDLYSPAVARVRAEPGDGAPARTGPGFFVGPGRLITLRSLLRGASRAAVTLDAGQELPVDRVIADDEKAGLVVVRVEVPAALRRGLAIARIDPVFGEDALIIGAPSAPGTTPVRHDTADGAVAARVDADGVPLARLRATVPATLAGAPVLNVMGQVIGAATERTDEKTGERLAVLASRLLDLHDAPGLTLAEWSAGGSIESTRVAANAAAAARRTGERPEGVPPPPESLRTLPIIPSSITRDAEGTLVYDGRFPIRGRGTPEDPYLVSWDLLVSANEEYEPRQEKAAIAERLALLDGRQVRIVGNIAFPLMMEQATELLVMMNPWDGCCIGIPPTPYDAVEVRLRDPVEGAIRFTTYAEVTGTIRVEPQLVGKWLVGLYVMDDATLTPKSSGGFAP